MEPYQLLDEKVSRYLLNNLRVKLACVCDKLRNGATYGGEILYTDPCRARVTHGLRLMSIGVITG